MLKQREDTPLVRCDAAAGARGKNSFPQPEIANLDIVILLVMKELSGRPIVCLISDSEGKLCAQGPLRQQAVLQLKRDTVVTTVHT